MRILLAALAAVLLGGCGESENTIRPSDHFGSYNLEQDGKLNQQAIPPLPTAAAGAAKQFRRVEYAGVRLEVPVGWSYDDERLREALNTSTGDMLRLAGKPSDQSNNEIVIAGHAPGADGENAATMRLSLRHAPAPTQAEMRAGLKTVTQTQVNEIVVPAMTDTARMLENTMGAKNVRPLTGTIAHTTTAICLFTEFEYEILAERWRGQTYICPAGTRTVKLASSYKVTEEAEWKPTADHLWQTFAID